MDDLWPLKGLCEKRLVSCVQTSNFVGERAVELAQAYYARTSDLPKLERMPGVNTKDVDLRSPNDEYYAVKGLRGKNRVTSAFCGYDGPGTKQLFHSVILVRMDELYQPLEIVEVSWDVFTKFAELNVRDKNYKLRLTNKLRKTSRVLFRSDGA